MKIKALRVFGDGKRNYAEGEIAEMDEELFEKVNSTQNGILAEEVEETEESFPKQIGRGNYELSNGEIVKGKDAAIAAQAEIDASQE